MYLASAYIWIFEVQVHYLILIISKFEERRRRSSLIFNNFTNIPKVLSIQKLIIIPLSNIHTYIYFMVVWWCLNLCLDCKPVLKVMLGYSSRLKVENLGQLAIILVRIIKYLGTPIDNAIWLVRTNNFSWLCK